MHEDDEVRKLREGLIEAFKMIRSQTEMICDLTSLVTPLVKALDDVSDHDLGDAYLAQQKAMLNELDQLKRGSLAACDAAIQRVKGG